MGRAPSWKAPDLDSTGVLKRAMDDNGWDETRAGEAQKWYERFLQVCYQNPGDVVHLMTADTDELWHTHITFTQAYRAYCTSIFGDYLDHNPFVPRRAPTPAEKKKAQDQYKQWAAEVRAVLPDMIIQCHP